MSDRSVDLESFIGQLLTQLTVKKIERGKNQDIYPEL